MRYESFIKGNILFKESRIGSLYSDFNDMIYDNPEGYEANIEAWINLIESIMEHDHQFILDTKHLIEDLSFRSGDGIIHKPLSLDCVLSEMINSGELTNCETFLVKPQPGLLQKGFSWIFGISKVKPEDLTTNAQKSGSYLRKQIYIYNPSFKKFEQFILEKMKENYNFILKLSSNNVVNKYDNSSIIVSNEDIINNILKEVGIDHQYFEIVKKLIIKGNSNLKVEEYNGEKLYVKFDHDMGEADRDKAKTIFEINLQIGKINSKIDRYNDKALEYNDRLKTLVSNKANKEILKIILKLKKNTENSILKLMNNLSNLELLLSKIYLSNDNLKYLNVVNNSNILLKQLNNESINNIDIDSLMDDIHDNIDQVEQINEKLNIGIDGDAKKELDDEEIDQELFELEKEVQREDNKKGTEKEGEPTEDRDLLERFEKLRVSQTKVDAKSGEKSAKNGKEKVMTAL